jgi:hypothetical protein
MRKHSPGNQSLGCNSQVVYLLLPSIYFVHLTRRPAYKPLRKRFVFEQRRTKQFSFSGGKLSRLQNGLSEEGDKNFKRR